MKTENELEALANRIAYIERERHSTFSDSEANAEIENLIKELSTIEIFDLEERISKYFF